MGWGARRGDGYHYGHARDPTVKPNLESQVQLTVRLYAAAAMLAATIGPAAPPRAAAGQDDPNFEPSIAAIADQLGSDAWEQREAATRELIGRGEAVAEVLEQRLRREADPEIRHRLRYVLSNIAPPQFAVLLVSAAADTGLQPGDVVTHVNGRPIRNEYDLRARVSAASFGAILRVRRADGTHEIGPVENEQIIAAQNYEAPRGARLARAVRLYATGYAERAHELLTELASDAAIRAEELAPSLRACIAYTAGFGEQALAGLIGHEGDARPIDLNRAWNSPSRLDLLVNGKAPFHLEWRLFTEAGEAFQQDAADRDLRVQRILVPAHRYADATARAFEIWWTQLRDALAIDRTRRHVGGNTLAVAGWMMYELGLRSECCRLIEPRSAILRLEARNPAKWVRVDTDAWLPYLAGDEPGALDSFYEHALEVLANPPAADEPIAVIRNPEVAARVAFFLYHLPTDERVEALLEYVARDDYPVTDTYAHWMMLALNQQNQQAVRRDLQKILPVLPRERALPVARAVAMLEYLQLRPDGEVFRAAQDRAFQAPAGRERDMWVAIIEALQRLRANQLDAAAQTLAPFAGEPAVRPLLHTLRFRQNPPEAVARHEALAVPLLAVPLGADGRQWVVLNHDLRLLHLDAEAGTLAAVERPTPSWFPNPLTWPWIGHDEQSGRTWAYGRRRVVELRDDGQAGLRLNIATELIPQFDALVTPLFDTLARQVEAAGAPRGGEAGEFLRDEVLAHHEVVADPDLYEVALLRRLPRDPRVVHLALRDGPHLLFEPETGRAWTGDWIGAQLGLAGAPRFFAQAAPPSSEEDAPVVWLFSDQGLIRVDTDGERVTRLALPGDEPYPAVIPESTPYDRADPRFLYCARLPEDGGQVYRVHLPDGDVEAVDMVNEALPGEYYRLMSRAGIRARLNERFERGGMLTLDELITDAAAVVDALRKPGTN